MSSPTIGVTFHGLLGHLTFLSAINSFGESESVHQQPHAPDELKTAICHEIAAVPQGRAQCTMHKFQHMLQEYVQKMGSIWMVLFHRRQP